MRLKFPGVAALEQYFSHNLSSDGIFIQTPKPLEAGREIQLQVVDGEGGILFEALAVVVWSRPASENPAEPAGMGLKFTKLDGSSRETIDRVIAQSAVEATVEETPAESVDQSASAASIPAARRRAAQAPKAGPAPRRAQPKAPRKAKPKPKPKPRASASSKESPLANLLDRVPIERFRSNPMLLIGVAVGVIALVAASAITVRVVGTAQKKKAYVTQLSQTQGELEAALAELDAAQAQWEARQGEVAAAKKTVSKKAASMTLSKQEGLRMPRKMRGFIGRKNTGYKLSSMSKAPEAEVDGLLEVRYDLEMYGDVRRLKNLLTNLYAHGRSMEVQSLEVSLLSFNTTQCRVKARVAFFRLPSEGAEPPEGLPAEYAGLMSDPPLPEEWQGLGGKKIRTAQETITTLRQTMNDRTPDFWAEHKLQKQEALIETQRELIQTLSARRDENKQALLALAAKLAKEAQTSSTGVARAKIDPTGALTML